MVNCVLCSQRQNLKFKLSQRGGADDSQTISISAIKGAFTQERTITIPITITFLQRCKKPYDVIKIERYNNSYDIISFLQR